MTTKKLTKSDFTFTFKYYGMYKVTYQSTSGKRYTATILDMPLIDLTKNCENPTQRNLAILKSKCIDWNK